MVKRLARRLFLIAPFLALVLAGSIPGASVAQDEETPGVLIDATLDAGDYPVAPAFVRLLRITLEPESSSPLHTHPGPEIFVVERGTVTVQVGGAAELTLAGDLPGEGTPAAGDLAPVDSEFEMTAGDQLIYLPQTPMTFRNAGSEPVSLLTVVLLAATSLVGLHPIVLVSIIATGIEPSAVQMSPELLALLLLGSWGISNTISPASAVNNLLAGLYKKPVFQLAALNYKYAAYMAIALLLYLAAVEAS